MKRFWAALGVVIVARLAAYWLIPLMAEDAAITFHAAIDPSWRASATSPVWALLVGLGDPPTMARVLSLAADCAAVWAAWRCLSGWGLGAFVALWCSPFYTGSAVSGLETHIAAAALLLARAHPVGYAIAACLRPDAAMLSLALSWRRWRWAVAGCAVLALTGLCFTGNILPQTVGSKLSVYGWNALQLFWWYRIAPLAVGGFWLCSRIRGPRALALALTVLACSWPGQSEVLRSRVVQERELWSVGLRLRDYHPLGTLLLEPAGMIPYQSPQLSVIDDVGLVNPWMAARRAQGRGWRTDAIARYRPDWIILRLREYALPETWTVGASPPYYGKADARLPGYRVVYCPGAKRLDSLRVQIDMKSSSLVILKRN